MNSIGPVLDWHTGVAVVALVAIAVLAAWLGRLPTRSASVVAAVRAGVQLTIVAAVIGLVFEIVWGAALFAGVMFVVAATTSATRTGTRRAFVWVAVSLLAGVVPSLVVIFVTGSTPVSAPSVVAVCGIVIGGTMTACSLALRRAFAVLREQGAQVEAALALGFVRRDAMRLVIDRDRPDALVPILDQTRTVGLVTLPGAFVGVLLGGGSASQAAAAQAIVLLGLLAAETVTVVVAVHLVAAGRILPDDLVRALPSC